MNILNRLATTLIGSISMMALEPIIQDGLTEKLLFTVETIKAVII